MQIIAEKRVSINGQIASAKDPILEQDLVCLENTILQKPKKLIYIAYHKPFGIETTLKQTIPNNLADALNFPERVFPVGRLDKHSEGLLLLTNDGNIFNQIIDSKHAQEKEYIVTVDKPLTETFIKQMQEGMVIMGKKTLPAKAWTISENTFHIILTQGLNRQIRRMCHKLGYQVNRLIRIRIMHIELDDLQTGTWRFCTEEEILKLKK